MTKFIQILPPTEQQGVCGELHFLQKELDTNPCNARFSGQQSGGGSKTLSTNHPLTAKGC
ncbi:MAG: hypothetical protein LBS16_06485 [Prevotellaceae bacterium]|nr:hypothetical protein [Prevotellaceae bacterium]